ncbi:hypothetical protein D3C73_1121080 [compost metagenome]
MRNKVTTRINSDVIALDVVNKLQFFIKQHSRKVFVKTIGHTGANRSVAHYLELRLVFNYEV